MTVFSLAFIINCTLCFISRQFFCGRHFHTLLRPRPMRTGFGCRYESGIRMESQTCPVETPLPVGGSL